MKKNYLIIFLILIPSILDAHTGTSLHNHSSESIFLMFILLAISAHSINKIITMEEKND